MSNLIQVTQARDGATASIQEELLIWVEDDTLGSEVTYLKEPEGQRYRLISQDTRVQIQGISTLIIPVATNGKTVGVNYERINFLQYEGTGSTFIYDVSGQVPRQVDSTDSVSTLQTRIYTKQGFTTYSFDAVNATNNTISLTAASGDLTGTFTANKVFQVYGSTDSSFDGLYTIASSAFSGGKTVITVQEDIPSGVATSGKIKLGSAT